MTAGPKCYLPHGRPVQYTAGKKEDTLVWLMAKSKWWWLRFLIPNFVFLSVNLCFSVLVDFWLIEKHFALCNDLNHNPTSFMKALVPKWKKLLRDVNPVPGSPLLLVLCPSALRAANFIRLNTLYLWLQFMELLWGILCIFYYSLRPMSLIHCLL